MADGQLITKTDAEASVKLPDRPGQPHLLLLINEIMKHTGQDVRMHADLNDRNSEYSAALRRMKLIFLSPPNEWNMMRFGYDSRALKSDNIFYDEYTETYHIFTLTRESKRISKETDAYCYFDVWYLGTMSPFNFGPFDHINAYEHVRIACHQLQLKKIRHALFKAYLDRVLIPELINIVCEYSSYEHVPELPKQVVLYST